MSALRPALFLGALLALQASGALADDPARSLISQQVFYGVALRMAILDALITKGE